MRLDDHPSEVAGEARQGRVALPDDPSVAELDSATRVLVGKRWLARAESELSTSAVCVRVARGVLEYGAAPEVLWLATRAVGDEVRHARLCHTLAELYLGERVPFPQARPVDEATFGDAPPVINALLLLVLQSCVNEGIACAYLQENLRLARAPAVRSVLHELLRDDVDHARVGWAHLASPFVGPDARRHVSAALPTLLRIGKEAWTSARATPDFDCPEHGCLAAVRHEPIVNEALEALILPGFAHVGIDIASNR